MKKTYEVGEFDKLNWNEVNRVIFLDLCNSIIVIESVYGEIQYYQLPLQLNVHLEIAFQNVEEAMIEKHANKQEYTNEVQ